MIHERIGDLTYTTLNVIGNWTIESFFSRLKQKQQYTKKLHKQKVTVIKHKCRVGINKFLHAIVNIKAEDDIWIIKIVGSISQETNKVSFGITNTDSAYYYKIAISRAHVSFPKTWALNTWHWRTLKAYFGS